MTSNQNLPSVVFCDRERLTKASRFGPIIRNFFVIECNETGQGGIVINEKEFSFGPRQCYVLFPGDKVVQLSDGDDPRGGIYCILDAPWLGVLFKEAGITSHSPFLSPSLFESVQYWIQKMLTDFASHDAGTPIRQASNIYGLMGTVLQALPAANTDAIAKGIRIMEANYAEALTIEQLANTLGLERTYFSSLFKEKTGISPYHYLTQLRIHKARTLLTKTSISIAEVAEAVGMDARNFARAFKKETGLTPLSYRKKPSVDR
ncbi:MAG: helix-turn-helix transcriptional regulator [Oscillospiraceae bacterium]|nr:helix-turn-helix transcriptional regulator [Oscillospiraceae bacterium]